MKFPEGESSSVVEDVTVMIIQILINEKQVGQKNLKLLTEMLGGVKTETIANIMQVCSKLQSINKF